MVRPIRKKNAAKQKEVRKNRGQREWERETSGLKGIPPDKGLNSYSEGESLPQSGTEKEGGKL